ncbi:MAG: hypothetical protein AAF558_07445, partial [Verrucomicrobiota bacterium]
MDSQTGLPVDWFEGIGGPRYYEQDTKLREDKESEFTLWIADFLKYIQNNNAPLPKAVSLQNEPRHNPSYYGCVYGG